MPWVRAITVWLIIILVESMHGTLRQLFLAPAIGDFAARRIGVFTGTALIFVVALLFAPWLKLTDTRRLILVGALWVALTVLFEAALGRFTFGYAWSRITQDYDLTRGGLMGLGLIAMLFIPLAAARLRGAPGAVL